MSKPQPKAKVNVPSQTPRSKGPKPSKAKLKPAKDPTVKHCFFTDSQILFNKSRENLLALLKSTYGSSVSISDLSRVLRDLKTLTIEQRSHISISKELIELYGEYVHFKGEQEKTFRLFRGQQATANIDLASVGTLLGYSDEPSKEGKSGIRHPPISKEIKMEEEEVLED